MGRGKASRAVGQNLARLRRHANDQLQQLTDEGLSDAIAEIKTNEVHFVFLSNYWVWFRRK